MTDEAEIITAGGCMLVTITQTSFRQTPTTNVMVLLRSNKFMFFFSLNAGLLDEWSVVPTLKWLHKSHLFPSSFPSLSHVLTSPRDTSNQTPTLIAPGGSLCALSSSLPFLLGLRHCCEKKLWRMNSMGSSPRVLTPPERLLSSYWRTIWLGSETWELPFKSGQSALEDSVVFFKIPLHHEVWFCSLKWLHHQSVILIFPPRRGFCLRIRVYVIGQLSWSSVNNSECLASPAITALGSRLDFINEIRSWHCPHVFWGFIDEGRWGEWNNHHRIDPKCKCFQKQGEILNTFLNLTMIFSVSKEIRGQALDLQDP